ncbi:hypothetical protein AHMF7616_02154 [Adhaeribacter pallidiroseus]|uniref:Uncharacterized protein n=1 Tax=Adhaeribacter pallidiroseus TaxID=2072847 RepID=A0A369QL32_9BACT|nr:hypothetical protein AHMF7616_02154 [Adhaeribacter pallidiroseus]
MWNNKGKYNADNRSNSVYLVVIMHLKEDKIETTLSHYPEFYSFNSL